MSNDAETLQYTTLDVFTQTRYQGNPLAIVRLTPNITLSQDQKQRIAREFNYSETVILHESEESFRTSEYKIDIFTAINELPLAGHPVVGSICFIGRALKHRGAGGVVKGNLITKAGKVPFEYDTVEQKASAQIPHDIHVHPKKLTPGEAEDLGVAGDVATKMQPDSPFVSIVKGMTFALVELPDTDTLGKLPSALKVHDEGGLTPEYTGRGFEGTFFYVVMGRSDDGVLRLRTRMIQRFEDPATGSASSACASWLAMQMWKDTTQRKSSYAFELTQGVEMDQTSIINVQIDMGSEGQVVGVMLGGSAVEVMNGSLPVPQV